MKIRNSFTAFIVFFTAFFGVALPPVYQKSNGCKLNMPDDKYNKIVNKYDSVFPLNSNYAVIWKKGKAGIITNEGKEYIKCKHEDIALLPPDCNQNNQAYFWIKRDGLYQLSNSKNYIGEKYLKLARGWDNKIYGERLLPADTWEDVTNPNISQKYLTTEELRGEFLGNSLYVFRNNVYDYKGQKIKALKENWRKESISGNEYLFDGDMLIGLSSDDAAWYWRMEGESYATLNGRYRMNKEGELKYIYNNKWFGLQPVKGERLSRGISKKFPICVVKDDDGKKGLLSSMNRVLIPTSLKDLSFKEDFFCGDTAIIVSLTLIPGMEKRIGIDYTKNKQDIFDGFNELYENLSENLKCGYWGNPLIVYVTNVRNGKGIVAVGYDEIGYIIEDVDGIEIEDDLLWITKGGAKISYDGRGKSLLNDWDDYYYWAELIEEEEERNYEDGRVKKVTHRYLYYSYQKKGKIKYAKNNGSVEMISEEEYKEKCTVSPLEFHYPWRDADNW